MGDTTVLTPPAPPPSTTQTESVTPEDKWASGFFKVDPSQLQRRNAIIGRGQQVGTGPQTTSSPPKRPPPPVPPRQTTGPTVTTQSGQVPPPPRPKSDARANGAVANAQTMSATSSAVLAGLPDSDAANQIRDIVAQHAKLVPSEVAVFKGIEYLDDVARIPNPDQRNDKLKKISDVLAAISKRREELRTALKQFPQPQPEAASKSIAAGWLCFQSMYDHLPDEFQRMSGTMAEQRVKTLMATKDEKTAILAEAKSGFKDDNGNDISATLGSTFKNVIEPVSTKSFERQSFYFDQFVGSPPQAQIKQLIEVTDKILAQGQKILDAGGKLKDVEELMAKTGIPKEWWPPQLVDTLQAWRKTERALMQEKVAEQFAKKQSEGVDITKVQGFTDFFCSTVPDQADNVAKVMNNVAVVQAVDQFLDNVSSGYGLGNFGLTALQTLKFDELPKTEAQKLKDGIEKSMTLVGAAVDTTVSALGVATSVGATIMSSVVPGLSIASCGVKLALAVKKLGEHTALRVQTGTMKNDAIKALGNASMEDGGAFLNVLDNEANARNKQISKDAIDVTTSGMDLAGSAAGSFGGHYGLAAQGVLKVASTAITVGSKVVFTNIDWAEAKKAKALLEEAQAGNPVARMEIFKNSGLYAKMYICVLCKEGSPLAQKFVVQRGIEEEDLDPAMSMKVLREALLTSADQKDENDIEDNWLLENTGAVGKGVVSIGKKVAGLGKKLDDAVRKSRDTPYDPKWVPKSDIQLTEADWKAIKAEAIKAGLYDEKSGIGDALGVVEKKLANVDATIKQIAGKTLQPTTKDGQATQKLLVEAVAALDAASATAHAYTPMSNPTGKPPKAELHKGTTLYLSKLLEVLGTRRTEIESALRTSGLKVVDWKPKLPSDLLDATAWTSNWTAAITAACLPQYDAGLGKSLTALTEAKAAYDKAQGPKKRDAALAYSDALNNVVAVGKDCLSQAGEVPAMADYVGKIINRAAAVRRDLDSSLGGTNWKPTIPPAGKITSNDWDVLWKLAVQSGYVSPKAGDGGLLDAIKKMEELSRAVDSAKDGAPKLKARMQYAAAAGKILLAKEAFLGAQRDVADALKQFIDNVYKQAFDKQTQYDDDRTKVTFKVTAGVTAAAWDETYKAAVTAGAVPAAKGAAKSFSDALKDFASKKADLDKAIKGKKFKDALKLANETKQKIDDALSAIDCKLIVADGYSKHAVMGPYLNDQRDKVKALLTEQPLAGALEGNVAGPEFKKPANFTFDKADFSKVKANAIALGVIPDQKTGMQAALAARAKSEAALKKAQDARPQDPEQVKKAKAEAINDAKALRSVAARLRDLSKNPNWASYAESAVQKAFDYEKSLM